jgi:crotonobetainyl-CoA:carnitine CoA-transferase CaiB-like acyl-CoA transferase
MTGRTPPRLGNRHAFTAPYDCYAAKDGYVVIGVANNHLFRTLMAAIGQPELGRDPRFKGPSARLENHDEVNRVVGDWVAERTVDEVIAVLGPSGANVPCAPVMSADQLIHDPHLQARGMLPRLPHAKIGEVLVPGVPLKLSASPASVRSLGPELGQHTDQVLKGLLDLSDRELENLRSEGVI